MRDDYICTKDLAYVGEDGLIYMLGRKDDVIITGGNKVAPDEIEEIAGGFEGIADCACIPVPHPLLGAEPKLFVEMENGAAFDEQAFMSICKANWRHIKCQNSSSRSTRSREPITENCSVKN